MNNDLDMMKALASLFKKKAAVMEELNGGLEKGGKNKFFDYKYIMASDVKHTVGMSFARHGLSFQMSGVDAQNIVVPVTKKRDNVYVTEEALILRVQFKIALGDTDTGAIEESYWFGEAVVSGQDDKAASKAATSALKYFLLSNLMIGDKEEDERDSDSDSHLKPRADKQQARKPAPQAETPQKAPAPAGPIAPKDQFQDRQIVTQFVEAWAANGATIVDITNALKVQKLSQWTGGLKTAHETVRAYMVTLLPDADAQRQARKEN